MKIWFIGESSNSTYFLGLDICVWMYDSVFLRPWWKEFHETLAVGSDKVKYVSLAKSLLYKHLSPGNGQKAIIFNGSREMYLLLQFSTNLDDYCAIWMTNSGPIEIVHRILIQAPCGLQWPPKLGNDYWVVIYQLLWNEFGAHKLPWLWRHIQRLHRALV